MFDKCLMGCYDALEFEDTWAEMVRKYSLEDNDWFKRLYAIRHKWCPALNRDFFSAGILSTQRIEGTNNAISLDATVTTSMFEFFQIFDDVIKRWRYTESVATFKNRTEKPPECRNACQLVKHAADVYTLSLFKDFYYEFQACLRSYIKEDGAQGPFTFYLVSLDSDFSRSHRVLCDISAEVFYCNCMSFDETKLLCYHILRVMHTNNVFQIPEKYIDDRWKKDVKLSSWKGIGEADEIETGR